MIYTNDSRYNRRCHYDLWNCHICTFMNESGSRVCSLCDTQRSVSSVSSRSSISLTNTRSREHISRETAWFNRVTRMLDGFEIATNETTEVEGVISQTNASCMMQNNYGADYDPLDTLDDYVSLSSGWSEATTSTKSSQNDQLARFERLRSSMTDQDKIGLGMLSLAEDG
mmetsp:Transcript_7206/g.10765  ORF Transcript_7206/g.10765 Transcript_7206/m.10765 type:complete len:170 (-) Transcript_7206:170-679(-)|eukprot:CAMPEP_0116031880 /NCGR_PEP_ID=MMETSP0321-20121206/17821_1 /TAXON_ID=163516 /ORGANISM="Leptocylindrus danicus var. danicus, Strain B650" /LENGTH=169 /DNA_ID=CAMNT_0003507177 /DNA_START=73 /DNA_END=582 /DNA_ORIENTATION=-